MTMNAIVMMIIIMGTFFGGFTVMMSRLLKMEKKMAEGELELVTAEEGAE